MVFRCVWMTDLYGDSGIDDESRNKRNSVVNKVFVEMLEKLGYDIQITYVKKEEAK